MTASDDMRKQAIDSFWETVPPLWGMVRSRIRASATADFGVTVEQFHVLRYVRRGLKSVSDLADARNISRPAVSQAVEVLVHKGLLTRTQDATDRRYVALALTPEGHALLDAVFGRTRAWMAERMGGMTRQDLSKIVEGMDALQKMLAQPAE
jgi:DNA-binding MarR family transcriptional regulator